MMTKDKYRTFCDSTEGLPLFFQYWWLDAVCSPENWGVVVVEKGEHITGILPYYKMSSLGFTLLKQPPLTQFLGPWIKYPIGQKYEKRLSHEKKIMNTLIDGLPEYSMYRQNFSHEVLNWLPFYWRGFTQTTRYTYVIENLGDLDKVWTNMQSRIKTEIRKANTQYNLEVTESEDIQKFFRINAMTYERQDMDTPYSLELFENLDRVCKERSCRKLLFAQDERGTTHATVYLVWNNDTTYYLAGGANPSLRNSGATSLLLWEAIQGASKHSRVFDFEGSMMEPVENFVRGFGAIQKPFHAVHDTKSRIVRVGKAIKAIFG